MKAFRIKQWNDWYESAETRKLKTLTYYGKPNKLIGEGIGATLAQPDNTALLGTWALLEALASTSERLLRGWLVRNGTALTAKRMNALIPSVPENAFQRALDHFSLPEVDWLAFDEIPGTTPEIFPKSPETGTPPGDSPATLPPTATGGREVGREGIGKGENKEGGRDCLPLASHLPLWEDILKWCAAHDVPPDYARAKIIAADERKDFAKPGWKNGWREKLLRFWKEDKPTWGQKSKKSAPASGRPEGWREGDAEFWWTDPIETVEATLFGAIQSGKKNAERLKQIIELRKKGKA